MLNLEPVCENHLNWLKNQRNRKEIMDFCRQPFFLNEINQEDWFKKVTRDKSCIPMIVSDRDRWVGYVSLSNIDWIGRTSEFSAFISPDENGKGYHKQAIQILLDYAFGTLNLNKVYSMTFETNKTEQSILEEIGFITEGIIKDIFYKNGRFISAKFNSIFKEWHEATIKIESAGKPV